MSSRALDVDLSMPSFDLGLNGVHVLISGAGSRGGIGAATVKAFIGQGARVSAGVNSTAAGLEGVEVSTFKADVTKEDEVKAMFESARAEAGGQAVQVLVGRHRSLLRPSHRLIH